MPPRESDEAHDVLAADEFGFPAADPDLHHGPDHLPEDPFGDREPHDVLAAEEFPMPAGRPPSAALAERRGGARRLAVELGVLLAALVLLRRSRRG
jgi:hypothetical protein